MSQNSKDLTDVDYLDKQREAASKQNSADLAQRKFTPSYTYINPEEFDITDSESHDDDTDVMADTYSITDDIDSGTILQTSGQFQADGDFFCGNGYVPETDKPGGAFASGTGNFNEPDQPAVSDFSDAG